ncbi:MULTISPECIES: hypothetical protein [Brevundimonas]|uniref:hypothetical protein n=1 Tax=Brevundimonas TaxID=41275 RepID=UPI0013CEEF33|nr:hypothetical protein [Brevundimonas lutea]
MDRERLREKARAWRRQAERESGADRDRSLELARSYEALSLNPSQDDRPDTPPRGAD